MFNIRCRFFVLCLIATYSLPQSTFGQKTESVEKDPAAQSEFAIPATDEGLPGQGPIRRYDWFQNLWQQRRGDWSKQVDKDQKTIVFLGDSITQGWGEDMGGVFGSKVANRGISGDTTRGMLIRLEKDVLALNPACVVTLMGTNDLEENATPEMIAGNVRLIVDALKKHNPKMPIVLCLVFPSSEAMRRPADKIREINRLCMAAVKGDRQVTVLDTWTLFADASGNAQAAEFPDLLHPNAAGYKKWESALRPVLETLGLVDVPQDDFVLEPGFESLFNGKDLTGWGLRPTSPEDRKASENWRKSDPNAAAWPIVEKAIAFDGKVSSDDGRFIAKNNRIVVTTPPEGRSIQQLYTTREFGKDFVLKLEFRATPNADSGIYIRGPQLQCRDYVLAGPYKELAGYKPQDWNKIVITVRGQVAECTCNGEVLEAEFKVPPTGPIGVEGDRGQIEYRRIRIQTK
jgi:lysophospholipase L1-like esterase